MKNIEDTEKEVRFGICEECKKNKAQFCSECMEKDLKNLYQTLYLFSKNDFCKKCRVKLKEMLTIWK